MSVLARTELEQSPLADLHALAAELGIEGFRALRRDDLIDAIVEAQGGEVGDDLGEPGVEAPAEARPAAEPVDAAEVEAAREAGAAAGEEEIELEPEEAEEPVVEPAGEVPAGAVEPAEEPAAAGREREARAEEIRSGVLDVLPNGSGFMRADPFVHSRDDVYVSPAQIRRCELRAGDELAGPVRPPRRSERYPSLVRVDGVNGGPAEPPEERPRFDELTPVFASRRLPAADRLAGAPLGRGSRVAVGGPAGAGATTLLRELVGALRDGAADVELTVVLAGVRPEEVTEWRRAVEGVPVAGGGFDRSSEELAQVAGMAVERAKRAAERGQDACVVVDSLDSLPPGVARRIFGAARDTEEAGSVTVVAATGAAEELERLATTRVRLEPGGAVAEGSGTLRAELLG